MDENQYEGFSTPTSHTSSDRTTGSNALTVPSKKTKRAGPPEGRRRAPIWDHYVFSQVNGKDEMEGKMETFATCMYCEKAKYKADPSFGTSNATSHIKSCSAYKLFRSENPEFGSSFDQKVYCQLFAEAVLCHAYPLRIVEHEKLRKLHSYLNPKVRHISRNTILRYCTLENEKLKVKLRAKLAGISSRICFTCDCWSAITNRGYLTLTAHYIDDDWVLKSHILNFRYFPPPHRGSDIYAFVLGLIKEWGLEGKTLSMTVDNASAMDVMISRLKSDLNSSCLLPCMGRFFHIRCCAHILNLIVQCGMKTVDASVIKLRDAVNYIEASDLRKCKFDQCVIDSRCKFAGRLTYDMCTRWNSTYNMMKRALLARNALDLFATREVDFEHGLSPTQWEIIEFVCKFLEPFHEVTNLFSGSDYPTANLYFANIVAIEKLLVLAHKHSVFSIRTMCEEMMVKFEKYWTDHSVILSVAVVLDPRYKLRFVRSLYNLLYVPSDVEEKVQIVYDAFVELYTFYSTSSDSASFASTHCGSSSSSSTQFSLLDMFEVVISTYFILPYLLITIVLLISILFLFFS